MSSMEKQLCRNPIYPPRIVRDLPRVCGSADGQLQLALRYAEQGELAACRRMVLDSAARGDNVGVDEFADETEFRSLLEPSEVFVARRCDDADDRPQAFIVIQPCFHTRSTWDWRWASLHIFTTAELERADSGLKDAAGTQSLFGKLVALAVELAQLIDVGYTDCMVRVAASCQRRYSAVRQLGFVVIATIPHSVDMVGVGLQDDFLLARTISCKERSKRSLEQIVSALEGTFSADEFDADYDSAELPAASFLPQSYAFQTGLTITVRSAHKDDDQRLFDLMVTTAGSGRGYGLDEMPTLNVFRLLMLMDRYCVVFEEADTGKLVGFSSIGKSWNVRNDKSATFESSLVVAPEYRGRGIGRELVTVEQSLAVELGYRFMVNDLSGSNNRMAGILRRTYGTSLLVIGRIPRGVYTVGVRWDDQVIVWQDVQSAGIPTFSDMAQRSRTREAAPLLQSSKL